MSIDQLPRQAVNLGLAAARLPLTAAEIVLGHSGDPDWPPTLAFDGAQARVKRAVGGMLGDDALTEQGRLVEAKVMKLRQAARLETVAEQRREEAGQELVETKQQAPERRRSAEATKARRQAEAEAAKREKKAKVAASAARDERLLDQTEEAAAKAVERAARRSRSAALAKEEKALSKERAAASKARQAAMLDDRIDASKQARKARP
jgi:hypothetical protein